MNSSPDEHVAEWEAMKTTFRLHIRGLSVADARGLATECYHRLVELERKLSRFAEGGDVWRINRLGTGESLHISDDCHHCLLAAREGWRVTGGLFDVTLGRSIARIKEGGSAIADSGSFLIDPQAAFVTSQLAGREIDLGGIGKGFALDELKALMLDWGATGGLLCAGNSSLLAFGPSAWQVGIGDIERPLREASLSASGTAIQGNHIVHPADLGPPEHASAWAIARTAARAEVWSTAAMLMTPEEVRALAIADPAVEEIFIQSKGTTSIYRRA